MQSEPVPDLPAPSAELVLLLALVSAHIKTMPKKRRDAFLLSVSESLGMQLASYNVLAFRPRTEDAAMYATMRRAQAWWRASLSVLISHGAG